jgi:hypothetical protein
VCRQPLTLDEAIARIQENAPVDLVWPSLQLFANYTSMFEAAEHVLLHNDIDEVTLDMVASSSQLGFAGPVFYTYTFVRISGK